MKVVWYLCKTKYIWWVCVKYYFAVWIFTNQAFSNETLTKFDSKISALNIIFYSESGHSYIILYNCRSINLIFEIPVEDLWKLTADILSNYIILSIKINIHFVRLFRLSSYIFVSQFSRFFPNFNKYGK